MKCVFFFFAKGKEQFVEAHSLLDRSNSQRVKGAVGSLQLLLQHWFIPEDVTPDYYHFTFWRMFQRFVAGTINVFGTQVRAVVVVVVVVVILVLLSVAGFVVAAALPCCYFYLLWFWLL